MAHPMHHAISSAKQFGGVLEDYMPIHNWFDETKSGFADQRHRAMRHHSEGIFWCEEKFGAYIVNSDKKRVPVRFIAEQHVKEDCGFIPTMKDWLSEMSTAPWMLKPGEGRKVLQEIKNEKLEYINNA
jgi:hypothetical protein